MGEKPLEGAVKGAVGGGMGWRACVRELGTGGGGGVFALHSASLCHRLRRLAAPPDGRRIAERRADHDLGAARDQGGWRPPDLAQPE
jgi:hypothetical protein